MKQQKITATAEIGTKYSRNPSTTMTTGTETKYPTRMTSKSEIGTSNNNTKYYILQFKIGNNENLIYRIKNTPRIKKITRSLRITFKPQCKTFWCPTEMP